MKENKMKICFVCTENIGRSLSAEYCLKQYLKSHKISGVEVISAATTSYDSDVSKHCFAHFEELEVLGIDVSFHRRKPLTRELAKSCDLIIAMSENHQGWIKEQYNIYAPLFSELIDGTKKSIRIPSPKTPECEPFLRQMVKDFYEKMPVLLSNAEKYIDSHKKAKEGEL